MALVTEIEIEHKFIIPDNIEHILEQGGCVLLKEVVFTDVYSDVGSNGYPLALADIWLRQRNGRWQLKYPVIGDLSSTAAHYNETEDLLKITEIVSLTLSTNHSCDDIDSLIKTENIQPFAEFTTTRRTYKSVDDITIDLDQADFGFGVGEVELVVTDSSQLEHAAHRIETLMSQLNLPILQQRCGKLWAYLKNHNIHLLKVLIEKSGWPALDMPPITSQ